MRQPILTFCFVSKMLNLRYFSTYFKIKCNLKIIAVSLILKVINVCISQYSVMVEVKSSVVKVKVQVLVVT
jgi:hypothetical protein